MTDFYIEMKVFYVERGRLEFVEIFRSLELGFVLEISFAYLLSSARARILGKFM